MKFMTEHRSHMSTKAKEQTNLEKFPIINPTVTTEMFGDMLKCSVQYPDAELVKADVTVPVSLIANVDVSASMEGPSSRNNNEGAQWSIMSLVQQCLITTIKGLNDKCTFGIVTFSADSRVRFPPTLMTEEMKTMAIACVNLLCGDRNTNLYSGIRKSFEVIEEYKLQNPTVITLQMVLVTMILHLDLIHSIQKLKDQKKIDGQMHIIGFGSDLKQWICIIFLILLEGRFDYISDFSMVGTVFVNMVTNTLLTASTKDNLKLNCPSNMFGYCMNNVEQVYSPHNIEKNTIQIDTKSIMYGHSRDFFIKFTSKLTADNCPSITLQTQNGSYTCNSDEIKQIQEGTMEYKKFILDC